MCYFITIAVPRDRTEVLKMNIPGDLYIHPSENPTIDRYFSKEFSAFILISGGCSCDLFNDKTRAVIVVNQEKEIKKLRRSYRKKGWSEKKIERAISQSIEHRTRSTERSNGLRDDVKYFVSSVVSNAKVVKILVHWYGADAFVNS